MSPNHLRQLLALLALAALIGCTERARPQKDRPQSSSLETAPPFTLARESGRWTLVSPTGRRFFSLGVCCLNQGSSKENFDPENPSYAAWQHYPSPSDWAQATTSRLHSWGFTTVGAWSDHEYLRQASNHKLFHTPVLHMGSTSGLPWWDMWDPKHLAKMEAVARQKILAIRDDPNLLGYYSDNEMGWWNAPLWRMTLEQPPSSGQRQRLITLLRQTYGEWSKLLLDFESDSAASWQDLEQKGLLYLRPGGSGIAVMRRFQAMLAERYYQLCRDIIRKYDRRALILGERYQSFYYPQVAQASASYVDIISTNLNAAWDDGTFPRFQTDTLHQLTGKPMIVSEFYLTAAENRSGNRNNNGQFPLVQTQQERAQAARTTLLRLLDLPYIVGVDWFQYSDEPTHGRYDGENFNFGLVDIHDRPYDELIAAIASLNVNDHRLRTSAASPDASAGVPPAPPDPLADFIPLRALKKWDRQRGFIKPVSPAPLADLYTCWNAAGLYLGMHSWDFVEPGYYQGGIVPKEDRPLWTVTVSGTDLARARIGAGREAIVSTPAVRVETIPIATPSSWNTAAMEIPAKLLGRQQLRTGDTITLEVTLLTHARADRVHWKGTFTLSD